MLSKIWDFPGLAFKWLFLNQRESSDAEVCNSSATLGMLYLNTVLCHQRNVQH